MQTNRTFLSQTLGINKDRLIESSLKTLKKKKKKN